MRIGTVLSYAAAVSLAMTVANAGTSKMDFGKMYEKECQGCH